jgi:hypothetical protein
VAKWRQWQFFSEVDETEEGVGEIIFQIKGSNNLMILKNLSRPDNFLDYFVGPKFILGKVG